VTDLHDTAVWAGSTMGRYDSGKASAGEAVYACGVFSTSIVGTAFTIESVGAGAVRGFGKVHIDIGGEGHFRNAINLNVKTRTSYTNKPIPNLVLGRAQEMPFRNGVADLITVESSPFSPSEIARVISPNGTIRLVHPSEFAIDAGGHKAMIDLVGGSVTQRTRGFMTYTTIRLK
jgi:hypothetical protein